MTKGADAAPKETMQESLFSFLLAPRPLPNLGNRRVTINKMRQLCQVEVQQRSSSWTRTMKGDFDKVVNSVSPYQTNKGIVVNENHDAPLITKKRAK